MIIYRNDEQPQKKRNWFMRGYGKSIATVATWFMHKAFPYFETVKYEDTRPNLKGVPTMACICGSRVFNLRVMWDESTREIGWYDLEQECFNCGMLLTAPTPIDDGWDCD